MIRFTKAAATLKPPKKPKGGKKAVLDELRAFLEQTEPETVSFLLSGWDAQQNAVTYEELRDAFLSGGISQAQFEQWQKDYSKLITSALAPKWEAAAAAAAQEVQAKYPRFLYEPSIGAGMAYIQQHGAELVTNLAQEQRQALNAVIQHVSGYTAVTPDEAARIMRPCIGLTKPQALANARYRESVKQAYLKAHPKGTPETAEKRAADAAARYAARQHRYRAQNIARTELAYAYNAGAYGATKDAQARGYIGDCVKVWLTAYDERVCPVCSAMDDEKRNMDELFSNGKLLPPAHPSCRCAVAYEEKEPPVRLQPGTQYGNINETSQAAQNENNNVGAAQNSSPISGQQCFFQTVQAIPSIPVAYRKVLEQRFASGSSDAQSVFNKFVPSDSVADGTYSGTPHFSHSKKKIKMNFAKDFINSRGAGQIFFHEHGHYIDFMSCGGNSWASCQSKAFGKALRTDFKAYIKSVMKREAVRKKDAYAIVSREIRGPKNSAISDLFGGMSNNKCVGDWGHWDPKYWRNSGALEQEAFAHMFEAQFSADRYTLMQKYFPTALVEFEKILKGLI